MLKFLLSQLLQAFSAYLTVRVLMVDKPDCILPITFLLGPIIFELRDNWVLRAIIFHYIVLVAHNIDTGFFYA